MAQGDAKRKLLEILNSFETAMLCTRTNEGALRGRPLAVLETSPQGDVWFATHRDGKVDEIINDRHVVVTMQGEGQYLSLTGDAEIIDDRSRIKEDWAHIVGAWFPDGLAAEDVVLIRVIPEMGEFWDATGLTSLEYSQDVDRSAREGARTDLQGQQNQRVDLVK